jgi:hypothetical protein
MPLYYSQKRKLRADEFRQLSAALEISSFSHNYEEELNQKWSNSSGSTVSRSVHYLQQFGFYFVSQARKLADEHFIKLVRNLVITFKGVLYKCNFSILYIHLYFLGHDEIAPRLGNVIGTLS